jgi:hypothetical protein
MTAHFYEQARLPAGRGEWISVTVDFDSTLSDIRQLEMRRHGAAKILTKSFFWLAVPARLSPLVIVPKYPASTSLWCILNWCWCCSWCWCWWRNRHSYSEISFVWKNGHIYHEIFAIHKMWNKDTLILKFPQSGEIKTHLFRNFPCLGKKDICIMIHMILADYSEISPVQMIVTSSSTQMVVTGSSAQMIVTGKFTLLWTQNCTTRILRTASL